VAHNARSSAQEEAGQEDSLDPTLRGQGPELVSLTHTAMGGQYVHFSGLTVFSVANYGPLSVAA